MIEIRQKRFEPRAIAIGITGAVLLLLVVYPLSLLLLHSFKVNGRFTIASYIEAFAKHQNLIALWNSLYVGINVTLLAVLIGAGMAWLTTRTNLPFKQSFRAFVFLTFITPPYIGTIGWIQLFGQDGYINRLLMQVFNLTNPPVNVYSLGGIITVMTIYLYPLAFWAAASAFERVNPVLEDAAASSGSMRWLVLTTITLPLISPSIFSIAILIFIRTISCFEVAAALGLPTRYYVLTTRVYAVLSHYDVHMACVLSMVLVLLSGGAFLLQKALLGQRRYTTISSGSKKPKLLNLGYWRLPITIFLFIFAFFTAILPLITILSTSLLKAWGVPLVLKNFSWCNYLVIFQNRLIGSALRNSFAFATLAASAAILLSFAVSYISTRTMLAGRDFLDLMATFPLAIPGPVLATAMILAFMKPPFTLYNTPWIIFVAYIIAFTPFALRNLSGSLRSIDPKLEEAAWLSGASWFHGLKDILLPLFRSEILTSWLLVFLISFREIPLSLMLHTQGTETVGVILFSFRESIGVEAVSALAVIVILITLAGYLIIKKLGGNLKVWQ